MSADGEVSKADVFGLSCPVLHCVTTGASGI